MTELLTQDFRLVAWIVLAIYLAVIGALIWDWWNKRR